LPFPSVPELHPSVIWALLPAALAIAALAGIESLLSATVADGLRDGPRHDADRELVGQGAANLIVPFFGGMPATGAIARTAVSIRAGARSRMAAVVHSLVLALAVGGAASLVARIPLSALAGVLLVTAGRMADLRGLLSVARATRSAAITLGVTLATTVLLDLIRAVEIGVAVAVVLALRQVARTARLDQLPTNGDDQVGESAHDLIDEHLVVFRIDGALFFATAHRLLGELLDVADVRVVVLRLSGLTHLDTTGARMLAETVAGLEARGAVVLLSGARAEHLALLASLGVLAELRHEQHVFPNIEAALEHARGHVLQLASEA
jgi:SulP family sulfate permease